MSGNSNFANKPAGSITELATSICRYKNFQLLGERYERVENRLEQKFVTYNNLTILTIPR